MREAAFKVGESSVEIGAHYFSQRLGLDEHLASEQLLKLGLRYFFSQADNTDIARRVEFGPPAFPKVPSFQLDRGRFENMLLRTNAELGIAVLDACRVHDVTLADPARGDGTHEVTVTTAAGIERRLSSRWVVDASGRAGILKRMLGLARPSTHGANAVWWRIGRRVKIDDWSNDPEWLVRVPSGRRWQSTVHLMGTGYWVWLIPLASGSHSFGIVADDDLHPFHRLNRFERAMEWLREFEPQCAAVVARHAGDLEDFLALKHFAHSCARVYSPARWALVGEAGVFTDPFYSPGSDFIAIGNDYVTDLVVRDFGGEAIEARAESFNATYLRLFDAFIRLYDGQYPIMGNAQVMTAKVAWDTAAYWAITALLFFQRRYTQPAFMDSIEGLLRRFFVLHARMQSLLRAWDAADRGTAYGDGAIDPFGVEFMSVMQRSLGGALLSDDELRERLACNFAWLERFARTWQAAAAGQYSSLGRFVAAAEAPEEPVDINAFRLSLARQPA